MRSPNGATALRRPPADRDEHRDVRDDDVTAAASGPTGGVRRVLGSGWIPAALVYLVAMYVLHHVGRVSVRDEATFTAWFVWCQSVPGFVLWRLVEWRRRPRPYVEDLILGSIFGIVLSVPVYLLLVWLGIQELVLLWPLLIVVPAVATRRGRRVLLRRGTRMPIWWTWSLAAAMLYIVAWSAHVQWAAHPLEIASLRSPYVDEPFHLSLVSEFRHHFPAEFPYVSGSPLRYHWLVYPFFASATWGGHIAPIVVVRLLGPVLLSALLVLGVAAAGYRLSGHRWASLAAVALVVAVTPLDVMGWTANGSPWRGSSWSTYLSPTMSMANALCPLLIVLVIGVLRGAAARPHHWLVTFLVMLAAAGAKSSMVPLFIGGLGGTVVVMLVVRRRVPWRVLGLAVMSVVVFALATVIFYGRGSRAMTFGPFQLMDVQAVTPLHLVDPGQTAPGIVRAGLVVLFVVTTLAPVIGALGLFVRGGWRRPVPWVLLGCGISAQLVTILLHHPSLSQVYFYYSALVPTALLSTIGWARAAGPMHRRTTTVMVASLAVGLLFGYLIPAVTSSAPPASSAATDLGKVWVSFLLPLVVAAVAVGLVVLGVVLLGRRLPLLKGVGVLVAITVVIGMCLTSVISGLPKLTTPTAAAVGPQPSILVGGLRAASWLRTHSSPDDLVATNAHTRTVASTTAFQAFWISGYTERRILVEGWAYIPPEAVGIPSTPLSNTSAGGPFWNPAKLALNDEVFAHPTRANIAELHRKYGVKWLFAQQGRGVDLRRLTRLTDLREQSGRYSVFEIRD